MNAKTITLCEAAQDITLVAWPILYGDDNPYDFDSRAILAECRHWAEEFESAWDSGDEDYMSAVEAFGEAKAIEFLQRSGHKEQADLLFVRRTLDNLLLCVVEDAWDRRKVVDGITAEVLRDCRETADDNFTSEDVRIALSRVLCNTLARD